MLQRFAKTLATHATGILVYYDYPISTGPLEATNNKISTIQDKSRVSGYHVFSKLKICALRLTTCALVG